MIENGLELTGQVNVVNQLTGELSNGNTGGISKELDPTVPQHVKDITQDDINKWNSNTGGSGGNYEPSLMCLEMSKEQIFSAQTYAKVEFDVVTKIGDKLIFEDNGVKIGAGIEYIKVSVIVNPKSSKIGNAYVRVIKNFDGTLKNTVSWIFDKVATDWGVKCLILPPKLLKVQEGDVISLFVYTEGSGSVGPGNGAETSITVEVVK